MSELPENFDDLSLNEKLIAYAKVGDLAGVTELLAEGADINYAGNANYTPLSIASMRGHLEVVKYLLNHGADASFPATDESHIHEWVDEETPEGKKIISLLKARVAKDKKLYRAIEKHSLELMQEAIDAGANVNASYIEKNGSPSLSPISFLIFNARQFGNYPPDFVLEACKMLVANGAKPSVYFGVDIENSLFLNIPELPLVLLGIPGCNYAEILNSHSLLGLGASIAIPEIALPLCKRMIELGADVNQPSDYVFTPLARTRCHEVATLLVEAGAKVDGLEGGRPSHTPLACLANEFAESSDEATRSTLLKTAKYLIQRGADVAKALSVRYEDADVSVSFLKQAQAEAQADSLRIDSLGSQAIPTTLREGM